MFRLREPFLPPNNDDDDDVTAESQQHGRELEEHSGKDCGRSEEPVRYLQVLPPHVDGGKGQLHLFPAGVLVPLVRNLDEDEEDPGHDAASDQHEDT